MERTKHNISGNAKLRAMQSELTARMAWASMLGMSYNGKRNLYEALGYPTDITPNLYKTHYKRQDIAKAIITRPVDATWSGDLMIQENTKAEETKLEKEFKALNESLSLISIFGQADKFTGLGKYGVLLLGFNDVNDKSVWSEPVIKSGTLRLVYVRALSELNAKITTYETDYTNPRYGLPKLYTITFSQESLTVHFSRIIHIVDEPTENLYEGTPRLEVVYNRLLDIEKISGGSAEMFWRGARPGYTGNIDKEYTMGDPEKEKLISQIDEYEHNLRRMLLLEGVDIKALETQVSDPTSHLNVQISLISAVTKIPKRMLLGSEIGELASTQDKENWMFYVNSRRSSFAEPCIVKPFITRMMEVGILPFVTKGNYTIKWSDLFAQSEKDQVEIGRTRTAALKEYASEPNAESIVPAKAFFELFLGLNADQIDLIYAMYEEMKKDDIIDETEIEEIDETPENIIE